MNTLLSMSSKQIRKEYLERLKFVWSLPVNERWHYGQELKQLKAAFQVAKESEGVKK